MTSSPPPDRPPELVVRLNAQLRYYNGGVEETTLPYREGATVADYLAELAIPEHEYMGVFLDGELTGDISRIPGPGSVLELVPAMSGG